MAAVGVDLELATGDTRRDDASRAAAGFAPVLAVAVTLAAAAFLLVTSALLLVVHPGRSPFANPLIIGQNQTAKTVLYLAAFLVCLPLSLIAATRIAERAQAETLGLLAAGLVTSFAAALIVARLTAGGLLVLLGVLALWWLLAGAALARAVSPRPWPALRGLLRFRAAAPMIAAVTVLGAVLCVTHLGGLRPIGLVVAAAVATAVLAGYERLRLPRVGRLPGLGVDLVVVVLLLLAVPDVVIFKTSSALPNIYFPPGVIQFQQDWLLGPTNQLLGGGALLVNAPSSQYGVGLIYFLAGWFHLVPIGYGMLGLLDGILTALFYVTGYCVLRLAGVSRLLAGVALGFAVLVFLYDLPYSVGALPEQGPLRFGLPMLVVLAFVVAAGQPRWSSAARTAALAVLGVSAVWALEAFAYTLFTFLALIGVEAVLRVPGERWRWLGRQIGLALATCVGAHVVLALATLAGTGHLPDWPQYLAYVRGLLLGGREGSTTYGFADWSPGLAMGAVCLASAGAVVLVLLRVRRLAASQRTRLLALAGLTAYAIASFSYIDNRSSTYLLLYVALPVLMAMVLWLDLLLSLEPRVSLRTRRGGLAFVLGLGVLMLGAAWPAIGSHLSRSALAHAYPGGGLRAAVHRLAHPPPIDPRAPEVDRLVDRYALGRHPLILFATTPDLATEALMRTGRTGPLFLGDPSEDIWIPSIWMPRIRRQLARLRPGRRLVLDEVSLHLLAQLHRRSPNYPLEHQAIGRNAEIEWILRQLDLRFGVEPVYRDGQGLVMAQLGRRAR